jgi:hypothetical protein
MKKIKVIVKPRIATWMKDTTLTFTMTDKVYDNSVKKLKEVESKCTTNEFVTIDSIVEYLAKLAYDLELPKKGKFIAYIYRSSSNYAKSCKYLMRTSVALIAINGRKIESIGIYRDTTAESHIRCNSVATAAQYIANKLGLSDSDEAVIAMAKHYQDITIR